VTDALRRHETGRLLTEQFWEAVQKRDGTPTGSTEHERARRRADRLARLMVDFDLRGVMPTTEEIMGSNGEDDPKGV
jgi:hypothetical protein